MDAFFLTTVENAGSLPLTTRSFASFVVFRRLEHTVATHDGACAARLARVSKKQNLEAIEKYVFWQHTTVQPEYRVERLYEVSVCCCQIRQFPPVTAK